MKKRITRVLGAVLVGMVLLIAIIWLLAQTLGNVKIPALYAGKPIDYWRQQLYGRDAAASNAAFSIVTSQLIPRLEDNMFHDTNDSSVRLFLVNTLNGLPGVQIWYHESGSRRAYAVLCLGDLGPAVKSVVPDLIKALKGNDLAVRGAAISSLGKIHSEPDTVIPLLIPYLEDDSFDATAADALAEYGALAKPAVPKLLPLLKARDKDDVAAARHALLIIDPETAAKAGVKPNSH